MWGGSVLDSFGCMSLVVLVCGGFLIGLFVGAVVCLLLRLVSFEGVEII